MRVRWSRLGGVLVGAALAGGWLPRPAPATRVDPEVRHTRAARVALAWGQRLEALRDFLGQHRSSVTVHRLEVRADGGLRLSCSAPYELEAHV